MPSTICCTTPSGPSSSTGWTRLCFYKPLTKDNLSPTSSILLVAELNRRLEDKQLKVALTPAAKQHIIDSAYDPAFGARPLRRFCSTVWRPSSAGRSSPTRCRAATPSPWTAGMAS